jgi:phage-related protein
MHIRKISSKVAQASIQGRLDIVAEVIGIVSAVFGLVTGVFTILQANDNYKNYGQDQG